MALKLIGQSKDFMGEPGRKFCELYFQLFFLLTCEKELIY